MNNLDKKKNLRTFDNYGKISFRSDLEFDPEKIIKTKIPSKKTLFILENVLTDGECNQLIESSNPYYESLDKEYLRKERDNQRVLSQDKEFADILFSRISKHLDDNNLKPCGFGTKGKWSPLKINSCFRYSKYVSPSVGFVPHRDATYIEDEDTRSILSILIYLNDDYQGGSTIFYKTHNKRTMDQIVEDEMSFGYDERFQYKGKKGSVLIFNHNMIHKGDQIHRGTKYLIRSDIIYKCIRDKDYTREWLYNHDFLQCIELYREAINQELDGNIEKSSYLFQKALAIRQCHKEK